MDDIKHFLEIEQGQTNVTREECIKILNECEPSAQLRKKEMLGTKLTPSLYTLTPDMP